MVMVFFFLYLFSPSKLYPILYCICKRENASDESDFLLFSEENSQLNIKLSEQNIISRCESIKRNYFVNRNRATNDDLSSRIPEVCLRLSIRNTCIVLSAFYILFPRPQLYYLVGFYFRRPQKSTIAFEANLK